MSRTHVDIAEQPITLGCYVLYAALWSRSATLKYGRVVALPVKLLDKSYYRNGGWVTEVTQIAKVQVVSVDRGPAGKWTLQGIPWTPGEYSGAISKVKVQTLGFLDRMIVVHPDQVPGAVLELLDKAFEVRCLDA